MQDRVEQRGVTYCLRGVCVLGRGWMGGGWADWVGGWVGAKQHTAGRMVR